MNCAQSSKLLPLYTGDDLSAVETAQVRMHLTQCPTCAAEAEAFTGTRNWMANLAPQFDEDFFADLSHRVRAELIQPPDNTGWTWLSWLRPAPLAALILLLLVSGLWLFQKKGAPITHIAITPPTPQLPERKLLPASPNNLLAQSHRRTRRAPRSQSLIPVLPDLPQREIALVFPATALPLPVQADFTESTETEIAVASEMLRIEMQTTDPNIRIIWFAPKVDANYSKDESFQK
jgi:hypothetical protein